MKKDEDNRKKEGFKDSIKEKEVDVKDKKRNE